MKKAVMHVKKESDAPAEKSILPDMITIDWAIVTRISGVKVIKLVLTTETEKKLGCNITFNITIITKTKKLGNEVSLYILSQKLFAEPALLILLFVFNFSSYS